MEQQAPSAFLDYWHYAMIVGASVMVVAAAAVYIIHNIRISAISTYKGKYDYINTHGKDGKGERL